MRTSRISRSLLAAAALALVSRPAGAAPGDLITTVTLPVSGTGVSISVDCNGNLFFTVLGKRMLYEMDKTGALLASHPTQEPGTGAAHDIDEITWDGKRTVLWGAENGLSPKTIWQVDPLTGNVTLGFVSQTSGGSLTDGISYDGSDDTIWVSSDASTTIEHYDMSGLFLGQLTPKDATGANLGDISGVQVGLGDLLYLGQDGRQQIVRVRKSDGAFLGSFASPGGQRDEGLDCDSVNFAPLLALWSRDTYNGTAAVIELEPGTCLCGGGKCNDDLALAVPTAPATVCQGSRVTLDGSFSQACGPLGLNYSWSDGSRTVCSSSATPTCDVTVNAKTTYSLVVTCRDNGNCTDTATVTVDVTSGPLADLASLPTICPGERVDLDASRSAPNGCPGALEYQFRDATTVLRAWGAGATFGPLYPAVTTTYFVDVRCAPTPTCTATASQTVTVDPGIRPPDVKNALRHVKKTADVVETWMALPEAKTYSVYRGTAKGVWPVPALRTLLPSPINTERDVPPPPPLYFYRVTGSSCGGLEGP